MIHCQSWTVQGSVLVSETGSPLKHVASSLGVPNATQKLFFVCQSLDILEEVGSAGTSLVTCSEGRVHYRHILAGIPVS